MRVITCVLCVLICELALSQEGLQEAVLLYEQGALTEAQSSLEVMRDADPKNAKIHYYLGLIHQSRDEYMGAAEYFEKAIKLDQQQSRYYQGLGEAYGSASQSVSFFKQMRLAGKIRDAFERAVELDGDNLEARSGLITYYVNAPAVAGGSIDKALEQAREISKRDAGRGHLALADIYRSQDDDEATEREYRAAIKAAPEEMGIYLSLGVFLTSRERYGDAMLVYERALKINPDDMGITYQVGRTACISKEWPQRGIDAFTRYLAYTPRPNEPGLDWANYRLGLIYQQQGNIEQAMHNYEQALAINSGHKEAKKALKSVRR